MLYATLRTLTVLTVAALYAAISALYVGVVAVVVLGRRGARNWFERQWYNADRDRRRRIRYDARRTASAEGP